MQFVTASGRVIPFVKGYWESHQSQVQGYTSTNVFVESVNEDKSRLHSGTLSYKGFLKDIGVYSLMVDALTSIGLRGPWNRGLDIGGAEGAVARLMRGTGLVEHVVCNDYVDLRDSLSQRKFVEYYTRYLITRATRGRLPKFRMADLSWNLGPTAANNHTIKSIRVRRRPVIDEYIAADFYNIPRDRRFDLISSLLVINYFDAEEKIARVSEMLAPGGVFVLLASSFWWAVNASMVIGHFPYAAQRLSRPDLERYFREHLPDEAEDALKRYDYFHKTGSKPTLNDYIAIGERNGLSLLKADYLIPLGTAHKKTALTPFAIEETTDISLPDILEDVRQHRPDVSLIDLKAAYVMAVFRKRKTPTKTAAEMIAL